MAQAAECLLCECLLCKHEALISTPEFPSKNIKNF
jgi:hypothetical protein